MGVFSGLGRVWKRDTPSASDRPQPTGLLEIKPDLGPESDAVKQEVLAELRRNYGEVLALVRKVDEHLDQQEQRSRELMVLAEQSTQALAGVPEILEHTQGLADAGRSFEQTVAAHHELASESADRQTASIEAHTLALSQFGRTVQESLGGMSDATRTLGDQMIRSRETDRQRERMLEDLVRQSQRHQMALVVGGITLAAAMVLAVLLVVVLG